MLKTLKTTSSILLLLITIISLFSCDSNRVFDEYKNINGQQWNKNDTLNFSFSIHDTILTKNLFINIRNNHKYPYSNLFLITEMIFPGNQKMIDTLEYDMTDVAGKFLGKGFADIKQNKLFYKENIIFPKTGTYIFKVRQAMRKNGEIDGIKNLKGITDIGFRIEKTQ